MLLRNTIIGIALVALGFCAGVYSQTSRLKEAQKQYEEKAAKTLHSLILPGSISQANIYAKMLTDAGLKNCLSEELSMALEGAWANSLNNVIDYEKQYGSLKISNESRKKLKYALSYEPHHISPCCNEEKK